MGKLPYNNAPRRPLKPTLKSLGCQSPNRRVKHKETLATIKKSYSSNIEASRTIR